MKSPLSYLPLASGFLVLVLALAVGVLSVNTKNGIGITQTVQNLSTQASTLKADFSLTPATGDFIYTPGVTYSVGISVNSGGVNVDGVDVIINFDPKKAQVISTKLTTTSLFEEFPLNSVDNKAGQIKLSALNFAPKPATGTVATFTFKPVAKGTVDFTFNFTAGSSTDSNVAQSSTAKDILGRAENGRYVFK